MPPVPSERGHKRKESKRETREALVRAGMLMFSEQGVDLPSLDAICARAGFTRGAFYVHFKDRDDFLEAVIERVVLDFVHFVLEATGGGTGGVAGVVERFIRATAEGRVPLMGQRRVFLQLATRGSGRIERMRARLFSLLQGAQKQLAEAVRKGQGDGSVGTDVEPELVALWLLSAALGFATLVDLGLQVPFEPVRLSAHKLLRIEPS